MRPPDVRTARHHNEPPARPHQIKRHDSSALWLRACHCKAGARCIACLAWRRLYRRLRLRRAAWGRA